MEFGARTAADAPTHFYLLLSIQFQSGAAATAHFSLYFKVKMKVAYAGASELGSILLLLVVEPWWR